MKNLVKKIRGTRGFTLVEVLIAVLLLASLSTVAGIVTSTVLSTSSDVRLVAKAEVLGDEVVGVITSEMRFCEDVRFDEDGVMTYFNSVSYGDETQFYVRGGKLYIRSSGMPADEEYSPIGGTVYGDLTISELTLKKGTGGVDVTVRISDGSRVLFDSNVAIAVLNVG